jgi:hypothetical protein
LIGIRSATPRDQRQHRAQEEKHDAGDHGHVIAGDREHMADAGNEHGVVKVGRDRIALARDQHRGDGAGVALDHGANARIDRVAQSLDEGIDAHAHACRRRRRDDLDGAVHEAGRADALKIKVAGKVIAAGPQRLQRRVELRFDLDEGAGGRGHAAAHREPHAPRLPGDAAAVDPLDPQHEAVGLLALLAQLDETGERNAVGRIAQHRMVDQRGLQRGNGKAGGYGEEPKRHHEADWPPAQQHRGDGAGCPRSRGQTTAASGPARPRRAPTRECARGRRTRRATASRSMRRRRRRPATFASLSARDCARRPRPPPRALPALARQMPASCYLSASVLASTHQAICAFRS